MKLRFLFIALIALTACKSTPNLSSIKSAQELIKQIEADDKNVIAIADKAIKTKALAEQDLQDISRLIDELRQHIEQVWGKKNTELPSNKRYVKYTNDYKARAIVDFAKGQVTVETLLSNNKQQALDNLYQAIVITLLTPEDPRENDIFSSKKPTLNGTPFLYGQVLDQENKPIQYQWRAGRFATHLVNTALKQMRIDSHELLQVKFDLIEAHQHLRQQKYSQHVLAAAKRYQIKPELIYGIIETESSFNPYAVSHANAYGLMQVVPNTAGADVYQKVKNTTGKPTKQQLFNPAFNIDIGTAYLHLLQNNYLNGVNNSTSQHYAMISAYNGGTGNVLKSFHRDRKTAVKVINAQQPKNVYYVLTKKHPRAESRRYLEKVTKAEKGYTDK
ncbi:DUF3393 domain-containing protein [Thalassotalea sp. LPB0316]|uniref:murein transglycosylase domain-containing protein n=1 Tax=Thalassotalea sp. LPB0316 TaxID=2769490 RepID=UPI0018690D44|nr:murein transglycosylase domain-containing protein [Thalassotalea sp. LPB0316]QOL26370.1 DUF3393 domain-containing protein [Thalassotalea sp. LPB0316]